MMAHAEVPSPYGRFVLLIEAGRFKSNRQLNVPDAGIGPTTF
jgi:hypothetical protein